MLKRFKMALCEIKIQRWLEKNGYDMDYAVYDMRCNLEMTPDCFGGAQPNEAGLRLLVRWCTVRWYVLLMWFVLTGKCSHIVGDN